MSELADALFPILLVLPVLDWVATAVLITLAVQRPRITFLTERALVAAVVSLVTTVYAAVALNTQLHFPLIDPETAKGIIRLVVVALGATPIVWLVLYTSRRR